MIVVETGVALATANSYNTVAEATAYLTARGKDSAWLDLSPAEQEQKLMIAMDYLAQAYRLRWRGWRTNTVQALDWPRQGVPLFDMPVAAVVEYNVIPREVKNAQVELAYRALTGELAPDLTRGVLAESVGSLSVTYDPRSPQFIQFRALDMLLAPYLQRSSGVMHPIGRA
jgi:hypothetical protein